VTDLATSQIQGQQYENLVERAIACIDRHGGMIDDARLVSHVFGVSGSAKLWAPLLNSILANDGRVSRVQNGWWSTRQQQQTRDFPSSYVVLDVETTGLKPRQHRVIEVAVIRYSANDAPMTWTTLVNPGRRIPDYIRKLTSIDDSMVASAPEFRSIAPTLLELVENLPIVGHNVGFDISFICTELVRCGLPRLINPPVDTMALADEFLPGVRRLALQDIARELGVVTSGQHRALADARVTAEVYRLLLHAAHERGVTDFDELMEIARRKRSRRSTGRAVGRGRSLLDAGILDSVPHAPGVYIMRDSDDRVIYVGKAKDLRKRVGSYYSQPLGYTRKMDGLLESLATIDTTVVGTELEALILESQLIRRYRPRFNTVQRNAEQYSYIKVDTANRWPTVNLARDRHNDDARYYGPFRSTKSARDAVHLINNTLPLRTCKRSFKDGRSLGAPCIELSLKRCSGPCMGIADPEEYRRYVNLVVHYLDGDENALLPYLHERLESAARSLEYEKASRLRDDIGRANRLVLEQATIGLAASHKHAILVLPGPTKLDRAIWYLYNGQQWAQLQVDDTSSELDISERLGASRQRAILAGESMLLNHQSIDETILLARWIKRSPDHPALIPWPDGRSAAAMVQLALAVDLGQPFGVEASEPVD
jgi:DNA polymerase III subunit epsilon